MLMMEVIGFAENIRRGLKAVLDAMRTEPEGTVLSSCQRWAFAGRGFASSPVRVMAALKAIIWGSIVGSPGS
jgi:hypothetical protein